MRIPLPEARISTSAKLRLTGSCASFTPFETGASTLELPNPPLQRTWSSLTLGTTPLNGKVVRPKREDGEPGAPANALGPKRAARYLLWRCHRVPLCKFGDNMDPRALRRNFLGRLFTGLRVVWPILSVLLGLMIALGLVIGLREGWSIQESI